jgi:hypothetical protein
MPVTPTPQTIPLDLPEEYLDFLERASLASGLPPQDVLRGALAMLKADDLTREEVLADIPAVGGEKRPDLKKAYLAAWDRWSESHGQQLPLSDGLAAFVAQKMAEGGSKDATGVVMLALLRYARVMGFLGGEEYQDS